MRARGIIAAAAVVASAAALFAGTRADLRLLRRIERVDGKGSGLDADTLRGLTPQQMLGDMTGGLETLRAQLYAHNQRATLVPGEEMHRFADCDAPKDVALSCAGGAIAGATESPITWMGVVIGDGTSTVDRCLVVVHAGGSAPQTTIESTVRCVKVP